MAIKEVKQFEIINRETRVLKRFVEEFSPVSHEEIKEMSYDTLFDTVAKIARKRKHKWLIQSI